jgi:uncharacterized phage protein gp47/JayE
LNAATGVQLDDLCALVGVTRDPATQSQATVTLGGVAGTFIGAGSLVEGGGADDAARWATSADATIGGGGTVDIVVVAVEAGATAASIGVIDALVTSVAGWETVTNAAAATPGTDLESDAALRQKRARSLSGGGQRTLAALRADLLALDFLSAVVVVDNVTAAAVTTSGISLDPHSFATVVYPGGLTNAQEKEIAAIVYANEPAGIKSMGAESGTVTDGAGVAQTVRWAYATTTAVDVDVELTLAAGYLLGDMTAPVTAAVEAYFDGLSVGDDVRILGVLVAVAGVEGVVGATALLDAGSADVAINLAHVAIPGTITVTEAP